MTFSPRARLDVAQLEMEPPPKDLRTVHVILLNGIRDVERRLQQLELSYYGDGRNSVDEVTETAAAIKPMLTVAGVRAFLSVEQVSSATRRRDVDLDGLNQLASTAPQSRPQPAVSGGNIAPATDAGSSATKSQADNQEAKTESAKESVSDVQPTDKDAQTRTSTTTGENADSAVSDKQETKDEPTAKKYADSMKANVPPAGQTVRNKENDVLFNLSRTLRDCLRKVLDFVPDRFDDVIFDARRLQSFLRKYCVSFYDTIDDTTKEDGKGMLETAVSYDDQIQRRISTVDDALVSIRTLSHLFQKSELRVADFGHFGVDMSRRAACAHAPFLMLFPASCERVRVALDEMRAWIADDAAYPDFINNDVIDLDRRVKVAGRQIVSLRAAYHRSAFRARQLQSSCDQLRADIKKTQAREDQLVVNEEILAAETEELRTEGETTEYRLNELTRNASLYRPEDHYEKYNELSERLRDIRQRLPVAEQRLDSIRQKLAQLAEKKHRFKSECKRLAEIETERNEISARLAEQEVEHNVCSTTLSAARRILLCKRSPDAVSKIFYDRPVHLNNVSRLPGAHTGNDNDVFDTTCKIVASRINGDWQVLYRALPFHPPRGVSTVDHDIAEIGESRDSATAAADRALSRWRRFHTRSCVDDLTSTLNRIGRADVLRRVAARTRRRTQPTTATVTVTEAPEWLEPHLVPYWREIERYDQLRASHHV